MANQLRMQHDDEIGEEVSQEEAEAVQREVMHAIMGSPTIEPRFPGSQPVSLAASNVHLLSKHRYYVTWKADGTRYMLYIGILGTYLIDRSFKVRRVQMRWPTANPKLTTKYDPNTPHNGTLLDGEMVVDVDKASGKQTRRYLAYDIMQLHGDPLRLCDFKVQESHSAFCKCFGLVATALCDTFVKEPHCSKGCVQLLAMCASQAMSLCPLNALHQTCLGAFW